MKMKTNSPLFYILFASLFLLSIGCVEINEEFSEVRDEIISQLDNDYRSEFQFSIGSVGITVSSWFVDFAANEEFIDDMMRDISGVQLGVYERIKGSSTADFGILQKIEDEMLNYGWKSLVRSVDGNEANAVYLRSDPEELLQRIFVVSLTDDELVLVEVEGDLKEIIATVIKEKGVEFERI